MRKASSLLICLTVLLSPCHFYGNQKPVRFSDIRPELESAIGQLSAHINVFEDVLNKMDASAKANQSYNEQKNIFLSSQLAIATVVAILEYNRDLLILFSDLKDENRKKFYEIRIESMQTSVKQINNMYRQIMINYTIFPSDFFEQAVVNTERRTIMASIASLEKCIALLKSVDPK
ncbi:MAG: hypothetical protein R3274_02585 [Desulfobacterales bacterium]|nr:hypothetical protein [Desulfobacterales bacterium]